MERLTKRVGVDEAVPICDFDICALFKRFGKCKTGTQNFPFGMWERHCNDTCILGRMIDRLADYEDTGLTPEQIAAQKWIPVSEPPKEKGCYFAVVKHWYDGKPVVREVYWNSADWLSCYKREEITPRVTHWMPLLEPHEED